MAGTRSGFWSGVSSLLCLQWWNVTKYIYSSTFCTIVRYFIHTLHYYFYSTALHLRWLLDHTLTQFNLISDAFTQVTILCTLHNTTRLEPICNKCLGELPPTRSPWRSEQSGRAASATFNGVPGQCVGSLAAKSAIHTTCSLTAETTQLFSFSGGVRGLSRVLHAAAWAVGGKEAKKKKKRKKKETSDYLR